MQPIALFKVRSRLDLFDNQIKCRLAHKLFVDVKTFYCEPEVRNHDVSVLLVRLDVLLVSWLYELFVLVKESENVELAFNFFVHFSEILAALDCDGQRLPSWQSDVVVCFDVDLKVKHVEQRFVCKYEMAFDDDDVARFDVDPLVFSPLGLLVVLRHAEHGDALLTWTAVSVWVDWDPLWAFRSRLRSDCRSRTLCWFCRRVAPSTALERCYLWSVFSLVGLDDFEFFFVWRASLRPGLAEQRNVEVRTLDNRDLFAQTNFDVLDKRRFAAWWTSANADQEHVVYTTIRCLAFNNNILLFANSLKIWRSEIFWNSITILWKSSYKIKELSLEFQKISNLQIFNECK